MPGSALNVFIATPVHYYPATEVCHAAIITTIDDEFVATVRQLDDAEAVSDHQGVVYDNALTGTGSWHYPASCTNLTPA